MACKYVDNFEFPSEAGFTGSAGKTMVSGYARGGTVKQAVAAFKKADAKQDAKLVAKAVESVKPMKKAEGGMSSESLRARQMDTEVERRAFASKATPTRQMNTEAERRAFASKATPARQMNTEAERRAFASKAAPARQMSPESLRARQMDTEVERRAFEAKPMKKGLGGIVKALSPLAAIASGDAPKGIGALGGVAGLLLEDALRKKRNRQPVVAPTTDVVAPTGMRRGGKVGVPVHNRAPMFGKKY